MAMAHSSLLLKVLSLLLAISTSADAAARVPAIYVFGDSTADVGNNNYLPGDSASKANYPPNGIDYPGGVPTGRFCNGYVGVDFLAQRMGFEQSPPAALSIKDATQNLKGVNYASAGSGVFDETGKSECLSMNEQIDRFENAVKWIAETEGKKAAGKLLAKSVFIFSTVNNDMFAFAGGTAGKHSSADKDQFVSIVASTLKNQLKRLYHLGARKFAMFGTGLIGCPPALRALTPDGSCVEDLNDLSRRFNKAMKEEMRQLSLKLKGFKYSYVNAYHVFTVISQDPLKFGFKETRSACCGSGKLNAATMCTPNSTYCSNRDEHTSWDWVHPTQAAYKVTARFAYDGSRVFAEPMNIGELACA